MTTEWLSEQEYLVRERAAQYKSEFRARRMVAMTGASRAHNLISLNVASELRTRLRERPCEVYVNDMRVKVRASGLYAYPDVVAVCGPPAFEDAQGDTLLNPTVLVEILSPSTKAYDRGEKLEQYLRLDSLREIVLMAQDVMSVQHWSRTGGTWGLRDVDAVLHLPSLDCSIPLREIYERVEFALES